MEQDKKTILVVEDEKPLLDAIKKKLELCNFEVVTARSASQALDYLNDLEKVDLVWMDHYLLGKESGLDVVVAMKKEGSKWKNIPIFIVSNTASPEKVKSYLHLGVEKYFTKADFRLDDIINDINSIFNRECGE